MQIDNGKKICQFNGCCLKIKAVGGQGQSQQVTICLPNHKARDTKRIAPKFGTDCIKIDKITEWTMFADAFFYNQRRLTFVFHYLTSY